MYNSAGSRWLLGAGLSVSDGCSFWRIPLLLLRRRRAKFRDVHFFVLLVAKLNPACLVRYILARLTWSGSLTLVNGLDTLNMYLPLSTCSTRKIQLPCDAEECLAVSKEKGAEAIILGSY